VLTRATLCWIARVSATCCSYLQNWKLFYVAGEEVFSFLKNDTKGYFEKRIFADTQTIYDWLNGEIQKPVRPKNSLSATIYKVTL